MTGTFDHWGAAAGSYGGSFRLASSSADPCALPDHPVTTFIDERGGRLSFVEPRPGTVTWLPVRAAAGLSRTFLMLLWSTHHADPVYVRESRTLRLAAVEVEAAGGAITLEFPVASRPTLCISPRERVFVEVHAQEL